jgi:hypothetical protein
VALHFARRRRLAAQQVRGAVAAARARWSVRLLAAVAGALVAGLVGAGAGQWLGWRGADPLPTDSEAAAIARLALGGAAPAPQRHEPIWGYEGDGSYGPGHVRFTVAADTRAAAFERQAEDIRVRLHTAGWRVDPGRAPERAFVADKGAWRVRFSALDDRFRLDLVRVQPVWVLPAGVLGGLVGAALGWFAVVLAWRRGVRLARPARRLATVLALAGAALLVPPLALLAVEQAGGYLQYARPQIPLWTVLAGPMVWPAAGAALALSAAVVVTLIGPEVGT